ncbi:hypothetical protein G6F52_014247 [Rhizopus delemar]|uniref:Uncharacterized protein n=1 Tax=Rhizopus delemar TaxID=936053 RepID=A0A9P7C0K0_9FUNG|nr:hypothetical protein G6F54_014174 [Rhizopus delemar]KAG1486956.1 hypothetical protein G6F52_014247 [Rhizopus delemar]KAG1531148.1 hypothetical protein G6F50_016866 [Rhizopus delemar]
MGGAAGRRPPAGPEGAGPGGRYRHDERPRHRDAGQWPAQHVRARPQSAFPDAGRCAGLPPSTGRAGRRHVRNRLLGLSRLPR